MWMTRDRLKVAAPAAAASPALGPPHLAITDVFVPVINNVSRRRRILVLSATCTSEERGTDDG